MRRALFALAIIGTAVGVASACTDTLSISGMRQFSLSFKNARADSWDSTAVSITQLSQAKALSYAPFDDTSRMEIPAEFRLNCGTDSVDLVKYLGYSNYSYVARGELAWKDSSRAYSKLTKAALTYPDGVTWGNTLLQYAWDVGGLSVGKVKGEAPAMYQVHGVMACYKADGGVRGSTTAAVIPNRTEAFAYANKWSSGFSAALDSVGKGYDSVRVSVRITEATFSYDLTPWAIFTGVHGRAPRPQGFVGYRTSQGYTFVLPRPVALSILSPDGRTVRNLPASTSPSWDGRDASGRLVPRGVYMVRALGLGVLQIAAP